MKSKFTIAIFVVLCVALQFTNIVEGKKIYKHSGISLNDGNNGGTGCAVGLINFSLKTIQFIII